MRKYEKIAIMFIVLGVIIAFASNVPICESYSYENPNPPPDYFAGLNCEYVFDLFGSNQILTYFGYFVMVCAFVYWGYNIHIGQ